jgi:hypothetical protein
MVETTWEGSGGEIQTLNSVMPLRMGRYEQGARPVAMLPGLTTDKPVVGSNTFKELWAKKA